MAFNYNLIQDKILTQAQFVAQGKKLKANNKKIVFTNGCFDLLHIGHLRYLAKAKSKGDYLFIAINSDKSVKKIKGPKRPINNQKTRLEVLAALSFVDYVTIFEQDNPESLIKKLIPNVLVKGGDWPIEKIIGYDIVQKAGGKVISLPFIKNNSSTLIIDRILKAYGGN